MNTHQRKMTGLPRRRWIVSEEESQEFQNMDISKDMDTQTWADLKDSGGNQIQRCYDVKMIKAPRNSWNYKEIGDLLKCVFCRQFPDLNNYYFCQNEDEAHISCHRCLEDQHSSDSDIPDPICVADVSVSGKNRKKCYGSIQTKKCGRSFYAGADPLTDAMLKYSSCTCVFRKFGCSWTGTVDAIQLHGAQCDCNFRNEMQCPVTDCKKIAKSHAHLLDHLKGDHKTVSVSRSRSNPTISIILNWVEDTKDRLWVPVIVSCLDLDLLVTLELKDGMLFQWIYVIESGIIKDLFDISSAFRDRTNHSALRNETLIKLQIPSRAITKKMDCFSIPVQDFLKNHLKTNKDGCRKFMFDLKFA